MKKNRIRESMRLGGCSEQRMLDTAGDVEKVKTKLVASEVGNQVKRGIGHDGMT